MITQQTAVPVISPPQEQVLEEEVFGEVNVLIRAVPDPNSGRAIPVSLDPPKRPKNSSGHLRS